MSNFLLAYDIDLQDEVLKAVRAIKGVALTGIPQADGTVTLRLKTRTLDEETSLIRVLEEIHGVVDLRLLQK